MVATCYASWQTIAKAKKSRADSQITLFQYDPIHKRLLVKARAARCVNTDTSV